MGQFPFEFLKTQNQNSQNRAVRIVQQARPWEALFPSVFFVYESTTIADLQHMPEATRVAVISVDARQAVINALPSRIMTTVFGLPFQSQILIPALQNRLRLASDNEEIRSILLCEHSTGVQLSWLKQLTKRVIIWPDVQAAAIKHIPATVNHAMLLGTLCIEQMCALPETISQICLTQLLSVESIRAIKPSVLSVIIHKNMSIEAIQAIPPHIVYVIVDDFDNVDKLNALPKSVLMLQLQSLMAPEIVNKIPKHIIAVSINHKATPEMIRALPKHIKHLRLLGVTEKSVIQAMGPDIQTISFPGNMPQEVLNDLPSHIHIRNLVTALDLHRLASENSPRTSIQSSDKTKETIAHAAPESDKKDDEAVGQQFKRRRLNEESNAASSDQAAPAPEEKEDEEKSSQSCMRRP